LPGCHSKNRFRRGRQLPESLVERVDLALALEGVLTDTAKFLIRLTATAVGTSGKR
jgi:hypothetical protein